MRFNTKFVNTTVTATILGSNLVTGYIITPEYNAIRLKKINVDSPVDVPSSARGNARLFLELQNVARNTQVLVPELSPLYKVKSCRAEVTLDNKGTAIAIKVLEPLDVPAKISYFSDHHLNGLPYIVGKPADIQSRKTIPTKENNNLYDFNGDQIYIYGVQFAQGSYMNPGNLATNRKVLYASTRPTTPDTNVLEVQQGTADDYPLAIGYIDASGKLVKLTRITPDEYHMFRSLPFKSHLVAMLNSLIMR